MDRKKVMANKNGTKKSAAKSAKASTKKASKKDVVEVVETVEPVADVVTPTEAVVVDAPADITAVAEGVQTCTDCGTEKELNTSNFSMLQTGKFRTICKPCQTAKSIAWTTAKAPYRKAYARANFLLNHGIAVQLPNAKDWTPETVLMTLKKDEDGKYVTDRPAEEVYAEQVAAAKAVRDAEKANREAIAETARAERKAQREAEKAERDAKRTAEAEASKAEREAAKAQKAVDRAAKAEQDKAAKEETKAVKAAKRAEDALAKAETAKAERDRKAAERAEKAQAKAIEKAEQAAKAKSDRIDAANAKAIAQLKGEAATV